MPDYDILSSRIPPAQMDAAKARQAAAQQDARRISIAQEESAEGFQSWIDEGAFKPIIMARRFESLETKRKRAGKEEEVEKAEKEEEIVEIQRIEEISEEYSKKNPELQTRSLLLLRARISIRDTKEEILHKVLEMFPDFSLADEALDFLLQTTQGSLLQQVRLAKEELDALYGREVKAGKNIAEQAREFSKQGLGSPTGLRNLYRERSQAIRETPTLLTS